jgi:hypothetical protein
MECKTKQAHDFRESRDGRNVCVLCGFVDKGAKLMPEAFVDTSMVSSSQNGVQTLLDKIRRIKGLVPEHKKKTKQVQETAWVTSLKDFRAAITSLSATVLTKSPNGTLNKPTGFPFHVARTQTHVPLFTPPALNELYEEAYHVLVANRHKLIASNLATLVMVCYATYVANNASGRSNLSVDDPYGSTFALGPFVGVVAKLSNTLWTFGAPSKKVPPNSRLGVAHKCIVAEALCSCDLDTRYVVFTTVDAPETKEGPKKVMHNLAVKCTHRSVENNTNIVRGQVFITDTSKASHNAAWHVKVKILTSLHLNMVERCLSAKRRNALLTRLDNKSERKVIRVSINNQIKQIDGVYIEATFVVHGWEPSDSIDVFVDNFHMANIGLSGSEHVVVSKFCSGSRVFKIEASMPPVDVQVMEYSSVTRVL